MIALRLFSAADPNRQIDVRTLDEREEITIGRDAAAGWALADPDRALSRLHLKVALQGGLISVTDTSTNGVTLASIDQRLSRGEATPVEPGERLELGPYVLLIERTDHRISVEPPPLRSGASPFDAADDIDPPARRSRSPDPFSSALGSDPLDAAPLLGEASSRDVGGLGLSREDAWGRREDRRMGDWDGPERVPDPEVIIGSPLAWRDAPTREADDKGFGFDTPFHRPMLRAPDIDAADLAIPNDWDAPVASKTSTPEARAPEPAPPAPRRIETPQATLEAAPPASLGPAPLVPAESAFDRPAQSPAPAAPTPVAPILAAEAERPVAPPPKPSPRPQAAPATPREGAQIASPPAPSRALFEAFCAGARLDAATFAGEDPAALMERLGVVYRQMVLGLSDVMAERTALKSEYRMVRTTMQAQDNNPLKWTPPQKVAAELLRSSNDGFLDGPAAVAESFSDVKKHLLCMLAGLRAALSSTLDALAPYRVEEAIKDQSFVLKPRGTVAWAEYQKLYAHLRQEAEDSADSPVNRAFRSAYEKQLAELDRIASR